MATSTTPARRPAPADLEVGIARCRLVLSAVAILAIYVDPTAPSLTRWLPLRGGAFTMDRYALAVLLSHLAYGLACHQVIVRGFVAPSRVATVTTWADVVFGALIALVTEGTTSPFYAFFAFAVVAAGLRAGLRPALVVTAASVVLYLSLIAVSAPQRANFYIMRPVYLAITGYLVGYLGQQRLTLERELRELEAYAQRERIARSLHDGYAQVLAGINLRLESCREWLRRGRPDEAFREVSDLQSGVNREHDELRAYIRSLVDLDADAPAVRASDATHFRVTADFGGSHAFVEHVLQILLEGCRNVGRHAHARSASLAVAATAGTVRITIEDDGVGFPAETTVPWSIASRVEELAGALHVTSDGRAGARLVVDVPEA
jgi:signal transduction histidine kinase